MGSLQSSKPQSASVFWLNYNVPDSWRFDEYAVPSTLFITPSLHQARGVLDLPTEVAAGRMDFTGGNVTVTLTVTSDNAFIPINVILWWNKTTYWVADSTGLITAVLTPAMVTGVSGTIIGRLLLEVSSNFATSFSWIWTPPGPPPPPPLPPYCSGNTNQLKNLNWVASSIGGTASFYTATGDSSIITIHANGDYNAGHPDSYGTINANMCNTTGADLTINAVFVGTYGVTPSGFQYVVAGINGGVFLQQTDYSNPGTISPVSFTIPAGTFTNLQITWQATDDVDSYSWVDGTITLSL